MQNMRMLYFVLLWASALPNLILNGDFQAYPSCPFDQCFFIIPIDGIWFTLDDAGTAGDFAVKKIHNKTNAGSLFLSNQSVELCQKVQLELNSTYTLKYELLKPDQYSSVSSGVRVNSKIIFKLEKQSPLKEFSIITSFISDTKYTQICFFDDYLRNGQEDPMLVDNLILQREISNTTTNITSNQTLESISDEFDIRFKCFVYGVKQMVIFQSQKSNKRQTIDLFFDTFTIIAKTTKTAISYEIFYDENNEKKLGSSRLLESSEEMWGVRLYPDETILLRQILFIKKSNSLSTNFKITVEHKNLLYESLAQTQSEVVTAIGSIQSIAVPQLLKISLDIRSVMGSFFLLYFFNFWNLGLMYIFLAIQTYPLFMKEIYHDLLKLFWEEVNIIDLLASVLNINAESLTLTIEDSSIRELMQENKRSKTNQQFYWFGSYGVSSKISNGASENLWFLGITCVRLVIFKILSALYKYLTAKSKKINYLQLLAAEVIGMAPLLVVSSLVCITQPAVNYLEIVHKFVQFMILFWCIFLIGVFPLFSIQKSQMKNSFKNPQIQDKATEEKTQRNSGIKRHRKEKSKQKSINKKRKQETPKKQQIHKKQESSKKQKKQETPKKQSKEEPILSNKSKKKQHRPQGTKNHRKKYPIAKHRKYQSIKNKNVQKLKKKPKIQQPVNQVKVTNSYFKRNVELMLILFIPLLVILANIQAFLGIVLVLLSTRAYILIKTFRNNNRKDQILSLLMILVWYVHHGTFCCFYVFSKFYDFKQYLDMYNLLGIVSIITIYAGAVIELIGTVFQILKGVFNILIEMCKSEKVEPKQATINTSVVEQGQAQLSQNQSYFRPEQDQQNIWYVPAKILGSEKGQNQKRNKNKKG